VVEIIGEGEDTQRIARLAGELDLSHTRSIQVGSPAVMGEPGYHMGRGEVVITADGLAQADDDYLRSVLVHEDAHAERPHDEPYAYGKQVAYLDSIGRGDHAAWVRQQCRDVYREEAGGGPVEQAPQPYAQPEPSAPSAEEEPARSGWCDAPGRGGKAPKRFRIF
jgi:hypothetical protein